jgi:ribosomal small subunit protein bTHX
MGRGDVKTKKGKIRRASYGNSRIKTSKMRAAAKKVAIEQAKAQ